MIIVLEVILGLVLGSFLSVVQARIENPLAVVIGRSECTHCHHKLVWYDLIPLVSYLILKGKCHYCKKPIGLIYPLLELVSAGLAVLVFTAFGFTAQSALLLISLGFLLIASLIDIEHQEVHLWLFVAGIVLGLTWFLLKSDFGFQNLIFAVVTSSIIPLALFAVSREKWMGLGDVVFAFWIGVLVGYPQSLVAIFLAFLAGSIFGIIILLKRSGNHRISFGPFLAGGGVIALLFGSQILSWYLRLLGF